MLPSGNTPVLSTLIRQQLPAPVALSPSKAKNLLCKTARVFYPRFPGATVHAVCHLSGNLTAVSISCATSSSAKALHQHCIISAIYGTFVFFNDEKIKFITVALHGKTADRLLTLQKTNPEIQFYENRHSGKHPEGLKLQSFPWNTKLHNKLHDHRLF